MRTLSVLAIFLTLFSGCAATSSRWEHAALGATLADIASTGGAFAKGGFQEANPIYGKNPSSGKMLALNVGVYAGVWAYTHNLDSEERQRVWRNVTLLRLLATAWNLTQNGFTLSIRF
jgi:hypothetical protein